MDDNIVSLGCSSPKSVTLIQSMRRSNSITDLDDSGNMADDIDRSTTARTTQTARYTSLFRSSFDPFLSLLGQTFSGNYGTRTETSLGLLCSQA